MTHFWNSLFGTKQPKPEPILFPENVEVTSWRRAGNTLSKTFVYSEGADLELQANISLNVSTAKGLTHRSIGFRVSPAIGLSGPSKIMMVEKKTGRNEGWLEVRAQAEDEASTYIEVHTRFASDVIFSVLSRRGTYDFVLASDERTVARLVIPCEDGLLTEYEELRSQTLSACSLC